MAEETKPWPMFILVHEDSTATISDEDTAKLPFDVVKVVWSGERPPQISFPPLESIQ